jgi:membrane protein
MFAELQDSINTIWGLKPKPKQGLWVLVKTRLLSFGVIGALGFLLLVSLAVTAVISGLSGRLQDMFPGIGVVVMSIINTALTLGITTLLFAVIFRVLPDARIPWRDVWAGAFATSLLFLVGKFAISLYIGKSDIGSSFGTAGSLIVLLVWIYYSSIILYFGAEFTRAYVIQFGDEITPNKYAVLAKTVVVEGEHSSLQEMEMDKKGVAAPQKKEPEPEAPKKKAPLPAKKAAPATLVYEPVQPEKMQKGKQPAEDGLYRIRIEKKKETGIGMALAGLVLFFVNTALDQSREMRR